jgi:hypothetical protein
VLPAAPRALRLLALPLGTPSERLDAAELAPPTEEREKEPEALLVLESAAAAVAAE